GLIRAITDCGAGGFASALGEMGEKIGVRVWLERVPLKYQGLKPWEIWLSESQERMVIAVSPENLERLLEICRGLNVEATVLAEFTSDRRLVVTYEKETICDLDMEFLHHGLPKRVLTARWQQPALADPQLSMPENWEETYCQVMGHLNVCSKEPIVRMYDHGVQGSCALAPFGGVGQDGPNDAVVLTPLLGSSAAVVISHGLNPVLNRIDSYYGSLWAATEAVSNAVAVGANPKELVLIDNFIWPFPDEESLGALDRAVDACVDFVRATGMPWDLRKEEPYCIYDRFEFDVPVGDRGDCYDRYLVRLEEMRQSVRIVEQAIKEFPGGPILPEKMPRRLRVPPGEVYGRVEAPRGEYGVYIYSKGGERPYRLKIRSSCFSNLMALRDMTVGHFVADAVMILGSTDIVLCEVDR
ncbi:MAG: hypothetical protein K6T33_09295, partial [Thermomonas hydrothermalis]|uniref:NADH-quinone oxidoreductase subunit D-related protein n=1 Tax=Thermomonas hydrothermalis TaxID=213588 RepID=UPI002352CF0D